MFKISWKKIILVLFYIFIFIYLLNNSYSYLDPDLGWHLKIGQDIVKEKQLPENNYYNYTLNKKTWVDHEWLSNVLIFWLYDNLNYFVLSLVFVLIIILVFVLLNHLTQKYFLKNYQSIFFSILFMLLGIIAMSPHLGIRIQEIALLNLTILLTLIYHYENSNGLKIIFILPALFYFWASVHASFLIGLFILIYWLIIKIIVSVIYKHKIFNYIDDKIINIKKLKIFSLATILSLLATFITPYGIKLYYFLTEYKNTYYFIHIQEWLPFYYYPIMYWQLLYIALAILYLASKLTGFFLKKNKINLLQIILTIIFLILALKSKRHFPLFFIVSFPIIMSFYINLFKLPKNINFKKWSASFLIIKIYLVISMILVIADKAIKTNYTLNPFDNYCSNYPCSAIKFLKKNKKYNDLKLFNSYNWGGYLIWEWSEKQIFIDGRLPITEFAGHSLLEEYHEFFKAEKSKDKLDQYDIEMVLINKNEFKIEKKFNWFEKFFILFKPDKISIPDNYLSKFLETSPEWQIIYDDEISKIYIRT